MAYLKAIYGAVCTSKEGQERRGREKRKGGKEKRNGGKEKRKGGKKREEKGRKKMKKMKEVAYASRGRVLLLLEMPLSWGHLMAMELSPNIRLAQNSLEQNVWISRFFWFQKNPVLEQVEPTECVFLLDSLRAYSWLITCSFWCEKW